MRIPLLRRRKLLALPFALLSHPPAWAGPMLDRPSLSRSARNGLPWPWLPQRPDWLALYEAAWADLEASQRRARTGLAPDEVLDSQALWERCFVALYAVYGVGSFAQASLAPLDMLYRSQRADGALVARSEALQLPLLAWVELRYWQRSGDASRVARVLAPLDRYWRWLEHPAAAQGGAQVGVVLTAQQLLAAECLSLLAAQQRDAGLVSHYRAKAERLGKLLNDSLWDEETQLYLDRSASGQPQRRATLASFWPLLTAAVPLERARASIQRWLKSPAHFNTPHRFPSLPRSDADPVPQAGEGGASVLPAIHYAVIQGLLRYDPDFAFDSALNHLQQMSAVLQPFDSTSHLDGRRRIGPAYSPEQALPAAPSAGSRVVPSVGAAGLGPVALLIEQLLGIDVRADAGFIAWTPRLIEPQGLDRIGFQGGRVSLRLEPRGEQWQLRVQTDRKLLLVLALPGRAPDELTLSPGRYQELL
jgi:hypothetical protein